MPYPLLASQGVPYGPLVTFRTQAILPPSAVYVGPNDLVVLEGRAPSVAVPFTMAIRILTPQGEIKETILAGTISTVGLAVNDFSTTPNEGFLVSAHISSTNASRGQCFVKCFLKKQAGQFDFTLGHLLFQGYISTDDHLGYPQSPTESSLNGRGWTHVVVLSNPPAGSSASFVVPTGVRWLFKSIFFQLTTSAAVANRFAEIAYSDPGAHQVAFLQAPAAQTANLTTSYTFGQGLQILTGNQLQMSALPVDILAQSGFTVFVEVLTMQAADQLQFVAAEVEEWIAQ